MVHIKQRNERKNDKFPSKNMNHACNQCSPNAGQEIDPRYFSIESLRPCHPQGVENRVAREKLFSSKTVKCNSQIRAGA